VDCEQIQTKIESYLDGELTLSDRRDFECHVSVCTGCSHKLESMRTIQKMIRNTGYSNTPSALKRNIQNQLRDYTGEEAKNSGWLRWVGFGGGAMAAGSLATWVMMTFLFITPLQTKITDEIISSHVRSLMVDHVTDVKSSDQHTVKPWFNGRLDYSPPVKNIDKAGFELLGGRLDYLQGKVTAALVNKRRAHIINTFISKNNHSEINTEPKLIQRQGYNLLFWKKNGLDYWVISDLNQKELTEFTFLISKP